MKRSLGAIALMHSVLWAMPAPEWMGDVQIQAQKTLWNDGPKDNLSDLWGRVNLGAKLADSNAQAMINIRAFPEGFGYEALNSASLKTLAGDSVVLSTTSSNVDRFQVE